jgi:hypothetical protein
VPLKASVSVIKGGEMVGWGGEWGRRCWEVKGLSSVHGRVAQQSQGWRWGHV